MYGKRGFFEVDRETGEPAGRVYPRLISNGYSVAIVGDVDGGDWPSLQFRGDIAYGPDKVSNKADLKAKIAPDYRAS